MYLEMERANQNVKEYLEANTIIDPAFKAAMVNSLLNAVIFLHSHGVKHDDVKLEIFLVFGKQEAHTMAWAAYGTGSLKSPTISMTPCIKVDDFGRASSSRYMDIQSPLSITTVTNTPIEVFLGKWGDLLRLDSYGFALMIMAIVVRVGSIIGDTMRGARPPKDFVSNLEHFFNSQDRKGIVPPNLFSSAASYIYKLLVLMHTSDHRFADSIHKTYGSHCEKFAIHPLFVKNTKKFALATGTETAKLRTDKKMAAKLFFLLHPNPAFRISPAEFESARGTKPVSNGRVCTRSFPQR
jgi:serine/threonine protein kinase